MFDWIYGQDTSQHRSVEVADPSMKVGNTQFCACVESCAEHERGSSVISMEGCRSARILTSLKRQLTLPAFIAFITETLSRYRYLNHAFGITSTAV